MSLRKNEKSRARTMKNKNTKNTFILIVKKKYSTGWGVCSFATSTPSVHSTVLCLSPQKASKQEAGALRVNEAATPHMKWNILKTAVPYLSSVQILILIRSMNYILQKPQHSVHVCTTTTLIDWLIDWLISQMGWLLQSSPWSKQGKN